MVQAPQSRRDTSPNVVRKICVMGAGYVGEVQPILELEANSNTASGISSSLANARE